MRFCVTSVILPELDLAEQCALLQRCGYDGIELRVRYNPPDAPAGQYGFWGRHKNDLPPEKFAKQAEQVRKVIADHGLAVPALASNAPASNLDDVKWLAEGAAIVGAMIRLGVPPDPTKAKDYHTRYAEAVDAYGRALEVTRQFGVRVLIEVHGNTIHTSPSLAWRIARNWPADQIGIIYDLNNMTKVGFEEHDLALQLLGDYLAHVHCGAWRPVPGERDETGTVRWKWEGCNLNEGLMHLPEAFDALCRVGYDGFVSLEDFRQIDPETKLREAIAYFHAIDPHRRAGA